LSDLVAARGSTESGVRYVLSTRLPDDLLEQLGRERVTLWDLSSGAGLAESRRDVRTFFAGAFAQLAAGGSGKIAPDCDLSTLSAEAATRSEGNFLYARLFVDTVRLRREPLSLDDSGKFPVGLAAAYRDALRQVIGTNEDRWLERFEPILSCLSVAQEPLLASQLVRFCSLRSTLVDSVLRTLDPFLQPELEPMLGRRAALYHTAFREFLTERDQSGRWYCDARQAHERIVSAYRDATHHWRDDEWAVVDAYGLRHLLMHWRSASGTGSDLDALATPAFFDAVVQRGGGLSTRDAHLQLAIDEAAAQGDALRVLRWTWLRHRLRDNLRRLLVASGAASLLVRAGRAGTLEALDPLHSADARLALVRALGSDGKLDLASAVLAEAESEAERARLRGVLADSIATEHPARAIELAESASLSDDERIRLCTAVAAHAPQVDAAWQLAADHGPAQVAVVRAVAAYDAQRAVELATRVTAYSEKVNGLFRTTNADSVLADVCLLAISHAPELVQRILRTTRFEYREQARLAYTLVLDRAMTFAQACEAFNEVNYHSDALQMLVFAAAVHGWGLSPSAKERPTFLPLGLCSLVPHHHDVDVLARIELERLRDDPAAADLAMRALEHLVPNILSHPFPDDPNGGFAVLGGALALFDLTASLKLADDVKNSENLKRFGDLARNMMRGVVGRLTGVDPQAGWEVARANNDHFVLVAWANTLPASEVPAAITHVESIDARYSSTRAALAAVLASKLSPSEDASALLRLISRPVESGNFIAEREVYCAAVARALALGGRRDLAAAVLPVDTGAPAAYDLEREVEAVLAAEDGILPAGQPRAMSSAVARATALARIGKHTGAQVTEQLEVAAADAAQEGSLAQAVLASGVLGLLHTSGGLELARDLDHPVYRPLSVHQPDWPWVLAAVERVRTAVCQAAIPEEALRSVVRHTVRALMLRHDAPALGQIVDLFLRVEPGAGLTHLVEDDLEDYPTATRWLDRFQRAAAGEMTADEAGTVLEAVVSPATWLERAAVAKNAGIMIEKPDYSAFCYLVARLASARPADAVTLCQPVLDADDAMPMVSVLAAIAATDVSKAIAFHAQVRWPARTAHTFDALHAIALVTARENWAGGLELVQRIENRSVAGLALHDFAALGATFQDPVRRSRCLSDVLAAAARFSERWQKYVARGLLDGLTHVAPTDPFLFGQVCQFVAELEDFQRFLGPLTTLAAQWCDPAGLVPEIEQVTRLVSVQI
jgi:hypothetical protein